jgi:hypothetical protein
MNTESLLLEWKSITPLPPAGHSLLLTILFSYLSSQISPLPLKLANPEDKEL